MKNSNDRFPPSPHLHKYLVASFDILGTKNFVNESTFWQDTVAKLWQAAKIIDETIAQPWIDEYNDSSKATVRQFSDSCYVMVHIPRFEENDFDLALLLGTVRNCQNRLFSELDFLIRGGMAIGFGACEDWFIAGPVLQEASQYDAHGAGPFIAIDPSVIECTVKSFWSHNGATLGPSFHTFKTCDEEWANQMHYCPQTSCLYINHMRNWFEEDTSLLKRQQNAIINSVEETLSIQAKYLDLAEFHNTVVKMQNEPSRWNQFLIPEKIIQHLLSGTQSQGKHKNEYEKRVYLDSSSRIDQIAKEAWRL